MLLQSILIVYLEEENAELPDFRASLLSWAIGSLYEELEMRKDVLDSCNNSEVKRVFYELIDRFSGRPRAPREKWGKPRELITNDMIKEFQ